MSYLLDLLFNYLIQKNAFYHTEGASQLVWERFSASDNNYYLLFMDDEASLKQWYRIVKAGQPCGRERLLNT